jgi:phosphate starvation-inducible PhoH-like protein
MGKKKALQSLDADELSIVEDKMRSPMLFLENKYEATSMKALNYKIKPKCKNEKQKEFLNTLKDPDKTICFGQGSAGSGKSYISLGYALSALKDSDNSYEKIIIMVPTAEAGNMSLGYLKGTLLEKMFPYLEADRYTMEKILRNSGNPFAKSIVDNLEQQGLIEFELVNFARGKTFDNAIILICEGENYSPGEMLLLLTRIGDGSKVIITGDARQLDRRDIKKTKEGNGLTYAIDKLKELDEVSVTTFTENDIVRNPIISKILNAWDKK